MDNNAGDLNLFNTLIGGKIPGPKDKTKNVPPPKTETVDPNDSITWGPVAYTPDPEWLNINNDFLFEEM